MPEQPQTRTPLPFEELAKAIKKRRSVYGYISGLRLDRAAPGECWSSLPYRPAFVGDSATGVLFDLTFAGEKNARTAAYVAFLSLVFIGALGIAVKLRLAPLFDETYAFGGLPTGRDKFTASEIEKWAAPIKASGVSIE